VTRVTIEIADCGKSSTLRRCPLTQLKVRWTESHFYPSCHPDGNSRMVYLSRIFEGSR
jgi:endogenous inhibitor of DNA gyrase (YacG/DUF329 family)